MREVVKAPSMAKFSAVLTPPPPPRDSPQSGFFVRGEWNRIGPVNYLCFLGAVAKQQLQSFIKTVRGNSIAVAEILPGLKNLQVDERNLLMALVTPAEPPPQNV